MAPSLSRALLGPVCWLVRGSAMCIVTVSRGSYSGAKAVAEGVAERLGVPCVSREILAEAAKAAGISADTLSEVLDRPPSFFERVSRERDTYMVFVRAALYQQAASGTFVYHGHDGHLMLDLPNVVRVRVVAPMEQRVEAVHASLGLDEKDALRHIAKIDQHRAKWTRFLYGVAWGDPLLYDVIVNLDKGGVDAAVELVIQLARSEAFAWSDELRSQAANQALCSLVWSELAKVPESRTAELQIEAKNGVVWLGGTARSDELRQMILAAARNVTQARDFRCEIKIPSDIWKA